MRESWRTCSVNACTVASSVATRVVSCPSCACASGGVRSQISGGKSRAISMELSYARDGQSRKYLLTT